MFPQKSKYSLYESVQDFLQGSKSTVATITTCRHTMGVGDSNSECSAPEKWGNDMKYG